MGQYFNPVFLNTTSDIVYALRPSDYGCGDGIFGHTRAQTRLQYATQILLSLDGPLRLVWAGDYAENATDGSPSVYWSLEERHFIRIAGLIHPDCDQPTNMESPDPGWRNVFGVIHNLDKHAYIDNMALHVDDSGWQRTPLPTLTAEAGPEVDLTIMGSWARDRLYYSQQRPGDDWTNVTAA